MNSENDKTNGELFIKNLTNNDMFRILLTISIGLMFLFFVVGLMIGTDTMDKVGSYFGGAASSIAFIWIAATLFVQMKQIGMQRNSIEQSNIIIQRDMALIIFREGNFLMGRMLRDFISIYDIRSEDLISKAFEIDRQAGISDNIAYLLLDDSTALDVLRELATSSPSAKAEMLSFVEAFDTINDHLLTLSQRPAIIDVLTRNSPIKQVRDIIYDACQ